MTASQAEAVVIGASAGRPGSVVDHPSRAACGIQAAIVGGGPCSP
jgi:hypothetical protein